MIEAIIRPTYQQYMVDPVADIVKSSFTPNAVSISAGIFGLLVPILLIFGHTHLAVFFLLLSGYCDCLDGTLARAQHHTTAFGTVLDICIDRLVEFAVVYGLYCVSPFTRGHYCLWMMGSILMCVTSFLVVGIFSDNQSEKSFHYSPGIMERPEAFAFFIAMIYLPQHFASLTLSFTVLVFLTAVIRLVQFRQQV